MPERLLRRGYQNLWIICLPHKVLRLIRQIIKGSVRHVRSVEVPDIKVGINARRAGSELQWLVRTPLNARHTLRMGERMDGPDFLAARSGRSFVPRLEVLATGGGKDFVQVVHTDLFVDGGRCQPVLLRVVVHVHTADVVGEHALGLAVLAGVPDVSEAVFGAGGEFVF